MRGCLHVFMGLFQATASRVSTVPLQTGKESRDLQTLSSSLRHSIRNKMQAADQDDKSRSVIFAHPGTYLPVDVADHLVIIG
jgi:hypothetical protein